MTSIINNQAVSIQQDVLPLGKGIFNNTTPSLPPLLGAMAQDVSTPGLMYIGDGNNWTAPTGGISGSGVVVTGVSFDKAGQTSFTNCIVHLQKTITGTAGNDTMIHMTVFIENTFATTSSGEWTTSTTPIPVGYRPQGPSYFPCIVFVSTATPNQQNSYFHADTTGNIGFFLPTGGSVSQGAYSFSASWPG